MAIQRAGIEYGGPQQNACGIDGGVPSVDPWAHMIAYAEQPKIPEELRVAFIAAEAIDPKNVPGIRTAGNAIIDAFKRTPGYEGIVSTYASIDARSPEDRAAALDDATEELEAALFGQYARHLSSAELVADEGVRSVWKQVLGRTSRRVPALFGLVDDDVAHRRVISEGWVFGYKISPELIAGLRGMGDGWRGIANGHRSLFAPNATLTALFYAHELAGRDFSLDRLPLPPFKTAVVPVFNDQVREMARGVFGENLGAGSTRRTTLY